MLYKVKAKIDKLKLKDFFTALTDGSIDDLEPEGSYIVNAMQRALMTDPVTLEWYQTCHCETPLKHEREMVYDRYLNDIETTLVYEEKKDIKGRSFWDFLEESFFDDSYSY
ncbi:MULTISPECIES: hypothetical protein [Sulfurovum]|uniref:Uncharacterized protein n=1 Tax=Sulfurovum xiamenensis TaxID=3019066 RepID=A0ABT7QTR4_9BACT|nr:MULTISPECIES: hypothetical protein [Sulfurovum]EIF52067.1 hypothetical protein SULAR_01140 [Sulfurovum sp. AR]MDM5264475.1 hypothetical protein [Sulfurovum xiamenensis]